MHDTEKLNAAIDVLLDQLQQQQQEVEDTKKTINSLRRRMNEPPMFTDIESGQTSGGSLRTDEYYGKPLATAVQLYLERGKQPLMPEEILKGLEQGGFDFRSVGWKDSDRLRSFAIALSKNPKFHRLPTGRYGLRTWYDEAVLKRSEKTRSQPAGTNGGDKEAAPEKATGGNAEEEKKT